MSAVEQAGVEEWSRDGGWSTGTGGSCAVADPLVAVTPSCLRRRSSYRTDE